MPAMAAGNQCLVLYARPRGGRLIRTIGAWLVLALVSIAPARANDSPAMMFLGGGFIGDILADRNSGGVFSFHFRSGPELEFFHIRPSIGGLIATNRSAYGWLGLNLDLYFGSRIVATPSTAIGAYDTGDGQDLGGILQFRNGLDIAWRFDDWARMGVGLYYMSNYGIGDQDPGIASVMLFYAHPLGSLIP